MRQFGVTEARKNLSKLIAVVESGEEIVITRRGDPVALLARLPVRHHEPQFGLGIGKIRFKEGWDAPLTRQELENFLGE